MSDNIVEITAASTETTDGAQQDNSFKYEKFENKTGILLAFENGVKLYAVGRSIRLVTKEAVVIVSIGTYRNALGFSTITDEEKATMRALVKRCVPVLFEKLDKYLTELEEKQTRTKSGVKIRKSAMIFRYINPEVLKQLGL